MSDEIHAIRDQMAYEREDFENDRDFHILGNGATYDRKLIALGDNSFVDKKVWEKHVGNLNYAPCMRRFPSGICADVNCPNNIIARQLLTIALKEGLQGIAPKYQPVNGVYDIGVDDAVFRRMHYGAGAKYAQPDGSCKYNFYTKKNRFFLPPFFIRSVILHSTLSTLFSKT